MLKPLDVVVLVAMVNRDANWTTRSLAEDLQIPHASIHRSLLRLNDAGLFDLRNRRVNLSQTEEFLVHAVKYMFPAELGGPTRGVPTGPGAAVLSARLAPSDDPPPVWPYHAGKNRGPALEPLHPSAIHIAKTDSAAAERLALIDGIRMGNARVRGVASKLLVDRLGGVL
jgi:hypothetical protein